ncbi:MAG: hypothetical protein V4674_04080 [Patescibacteria group bacterium]
MPKENMPHRLEANPSSDDENSIDPLNPDITELLKTGAVVDLDQAVAGGHFEKPEPGRYAELAQHARSVVGEHEEEVEAKKREAAARGEIVFKAREDGEGGVEELKKAA